MAASAPQSYVGQLDPNLNTQLLTAQQQLARARALQGLAMDPIQAPPGQNGVISPLSVLAKALMAYEAPKDIDAANQSLGSVQSKMAQFQMQDQQDWMNHTGRYAPPPQQSQPPQPQPQDQPPQGQADPQQGQQQPSPTSATQPTFPALTGQALGRFLQNMGPGDPQSGAPQGQQPAPQQAGQSTVLNPMSAKNMMMAALLRGGSDAAGSSDAPPSPGAPGASVPSLNGKGDPAPGQLGTGPTAGGVGLRPPAPSPSAYASILSQNTGAAGGMPDPMSDPSIRYLSVGASRGYVPGEVAGKAVDNFYRMNDNRTDFEKHLISNGVMPGTPAWNQAHQDLLKKDTYTTPVPVAQGTTMIDPYTHQVIIQSPKLADGMESDFSNPTNPSAHAVSGYAQGHAGIAGATKRAEQANTVFTSVPGENGKPMSGYGGSLFGGGSGPSQPPAAQPPAGPQRGATANAAGRPGAGASQPPAQASRPGVIIGADPTVQAGRESQQKDMATKWSTLNETASNVQTLNSRLDNIADLAVRAQTGKLSDYLEYANTLLGLVGSQKATDAATAKSLLDKNASQIALVLGRGKTDATTALGAAANPGSKMPEPAIREAAANLKASNNMDAAKARLLQPYYVKTDPAGYQQAETQFNAVADPRIFQWHAMPDGPAKKAYAAKLMQQDPTVAGKVQALEKMGVFQ